MKKEFKRDPNKMEKELKIWKEKAPDNCKTNIASFKNRSLIDFLTNIFNDSKGEIDHFKKIFKKELGQQSRDDVAIKVYNALKKVASKKQEIKREDIEKLQKPKNGFKEKFKAFFGYGLGHAKDIYQLFENNLKAQMQTDIKTLSAYLEMIQKFDEQNQKKPISEQFENALEIQKQIHNIVTKYNYTYDYIIFESKENNMDDKDKNIITDDISKGEEQAKDNFQNLVRDSEVKRKGQGISMG